MKRITVGIDASRNRSGGAIAYLIGILSEVNPLDYNVKEVHLWAPDNLLSQLGDHKWLFKHSSKELQQSIIKQTTLTSENGSHSKYFTEKTDLKNHKSKINKNENSPLKKISSSKDRANSYLTKNEPTLQGLSKKEQAPTKGKKFFVQVGAFSIKNNAEKVVKSLNSIGIKAKIYTQNIKIIKHQVFSENFTNKDNAISSVSNFKSLGITPSIKKSGTTYNLSLGLFNREQEANRFIKKLKKSGHELNKKIIKIDRNVYTVLSKGLATKIKAQQVRKDITNHGFKNSFIRFQ